jgi:uncharacterized membrane protein YoaK (UPF0700 family)
MISMTQTEIQIRLIIAVAAFLLGVLVGYMIRKNKTPKEATTNLTQLQIASIFMFFGYLILTAGFGVTYSDLVATAILAITGGELVGKAIAKKVGKDDK